MWLFFYRDLWSLRYRGVFVQTNICSHWWKFTDFTHLNWKSKFLMHNKYIAPYRFFFQRLTSFRFRGKLVHKRLQQGTKIGVLLQEYKSEHLHHQDQEIFYGCKSRRWAADPPTNRAKQLLTLEGAVDQLLLSSEHGRNFWILNLFWFFILKEIFSFSAPLSHFYSKFNLFD